MMTAALALLLVLSALLAACILAQQQTTENGHGHMALDHISSSPDLRGLLPKIGCGSKSTTSLEILSQLFHTGCALVDTKDTNDSLEALGKAVHDSLQGRAHLFLISKLVGETDASAHDPAQVPKLARQALAKAGVGYWDCYMVHVAHSFGGIPLMSTWAALENIFDAGLARSLGVSNIAPEQARPAQFAPLVLHALLRHARVRPSLVQQEIHPYNSEEPLLQLCRSERLVLIAHSPFGSKRLRAKVLSEPILKDIAAAKGITPEQVVLRWHLQRGVLPIPSSQSEVHIRQNLGVAASDWALSAQDMDAIAGLNRNQRAWPKPNLVNPTGTIIAARLRT